MRRSFLLIVLVAALGLMGSCGSGSESGAGGPSGAPLDLPAVDMRDVASGNPVQLASLLPAAKPLLVWAWAPH